MEPHTDQLISVGRLKARSVLIVLAVLAVVSIVLYPSIASKRAEAQAVNCAANFARLSKAIHLYMVDNDDRLPAQNLGYIEHWMVAPTGRPPAYMAINPLAKYDPKLDSLKCPQDGHWYTCRFVVPVRERYDELVKPEQMRAIAPQPTSVLAWCNGHLSKGYRHALWGTASTYSARVEDREGFHVVLHEDGSVARVDAKRVRQLVWSKTGTGESWLPSSTRSNRGTPVDVFPGEDWPPRWAGRWVP